MKQTLITIRDILFRTFMVGFVLGIAIVVLTAIFWDPWSLFVSSKFGVTRNALGEMFVNSILYLRLYLLFVILTPAIALHWLIKSKK